MGSNRHSPDDTGNAPLHTACALADAAAVAVLLSPPCADVNQSNGSGESSLHVAARAGCVEIAKALLRQGAEGGWLNRARQRPVDVAANEEVRALSWRPFHHLSYLPLSPRAIYPLLSPPVLPT